MNIYIALIFLFGIGKIQNISLGKHYLVEMKDVHRVWGEWGQWSACNAKTGRKQRTRQCNNPTPLNGGSDCPGSSTDEHHCLGNSIGEYGHDYSDKDDGEDKTKKGHDYPLDDDLASQKEEMSELNQLKEALTKTKAELNTVKKKYTTSIKKLNYTKNATEQKIDKCKLKKKGEKKQVDGVCCGDRITMKCKGGCLKIHKTLYSCKMRDQSSPDQLKKVSSLCDGKEKCTVQASREMFGNNECPGTPEYDMELRITYSCDGGQDETMRLIMG